MLAELVPAAKAQWHRRRRRQQRRVLARTSRRSAGAPTRDTPGMRRGSRHDQDLRPTDGTIKGAEPLHLDVVGRQRARDLSLQDIWERSTALRHTRDRTTGRSGVTARLATTPTSAARLHVDRRTSSSEARNNPYCHHRALEMMKKAGKRYGVVQVEAAPGCRSTTGD